jgi:hypothetical protein
MADELDFIPLARAAALAHNRVFPGDVREMKMPTFSLALSPWFRCTSERRGAPGARQGTIAAGRFHARRDAAGFAGLPPLRFLVVSRRGLSAARGARRTRRLFGFRR